MTNKAKNIFSYIHFKITDMKPNIYGAFHMRNKIRAYLVMPRPLRKIDYINITISLPLKVIIKKKYNSKIIAVNIFLCKIKVWL